jgi:hypothetical protein
MSEAIRAKSANARATIAIRKIKAPYELGRSFSDCFEMNDGDEVMREIQRRALTDARLVQAVARRGWKDWLTQAI